VPKIVDHDQRRGDIAAAARRVLRRDGIDHLTVRNVAREAGLSPGALRHYFPRQDDLVRFALQQFVDDLRDRIAAVDFPTDPFEAAVLLVEQVLPLDKQRRGDMEVWFAYTERARFDPLLQQVSLSSQDALYTLALSALRHLEAAGRLADDLDLELEAHRLHALIDGLALHSYMHPERLSPDQQRDIVRHHLSGLVRPRDAGAIDPS
jgi:AcrR family transcriptional regulator